MGDIFRSRRWNTKRASSKRVSHSSFDAECITGVDTVDTALLIRLLVGEFLDGVQKKCFWRFVEEVLQHSEIGLHEVLAFELFFVNNYR